jgi:hypothetical protein
MRVTLEPALAHVAVAFGFLGVAIVVGLGLAVAAGLHPRWMVAYGILGILGWLSVLVIGMAYKILPFLVWLYRFSPHVRDPDLPSAADLSSPVLQWTTLALLTVGIAALAVAASLGWPTTARGAALAVAAGIGLVAAQHARLALRTPRTKG